VSSVAPSANLSRGGMRTGNRRVRSHMVRLLLSRPERRAALTVCLLVLALAVVWLPPSASAIRPDLSMRFTPPAWVSGGSWSTPLGTDFLGRDIWGRLLYATRYTILISTAATLLAAASGTVAGLMAGAQGGMADALLMRAVDAVLAFPTILLVLSLVAVLGQSLSSLVGVLALSGWAAYARVVRSAALSLRASEFVEAARALGATPGRIIFRHMLPNVLPSVTVLSTFQVARFMLLESSMSFLGLGVVPPAVTWGGMVGEARNYLQDAWWAVAAPGTAIAVTTLAFNILGDGLRDLLDPRLVSLSQHRANL
jgi:peptide/nickel transport system permease protein